MVKALIFSQSGVGIHCLSGTEKALEKYGIGYSLATKINAATLKGYDVLFLPGGNSASSLYINNSNIDVDAIKAWEKNGGVVIATCSGAYAASAGVDGKYTGYGLAPNIKCKAYAHEGSIKVALTDAGIKVLGKTGSIALDHENGPAFYIPSGKNATILANFGEGDYKGYGAIMVDGNTGLFSIHPELEPFYPDLIYSLMTYLVNKRSGNVVDFSVSDIISAGDSVKSFVEKNSRLPNYVSINDKQVTMPEFLYLAVCAVIQYNNNVTTKITYKSVLTAPNPTGSYSSGTLSKSIYLILAITIKNYIVTNSKAPNNEVVTGLGTIPFDDLVNSFTKILSFIKTNNRLPNTLTVKQTSAKTKGPIQLALEDAFGTTFNTFKEFYNLVLKYGVYSYYFDSKYTLKESIARIKLQRKAAKATGIKKLFHNVKLIRHKITNTFKSTFFSTSSNGLNCCNWAEVAQAIADEMDLKADIYGIYCTVDKINHALDLIENEWVDCAAGASEGYPYGKHWCNGDLTKNPAWCPYQKL